MVEHHYIYSESPRLRWQDDMENSQWLELFHTFSAKFTAVKSHEKSVYSISRLFRKCIAPDLQGLVGDSERIKGVLPALKALFLEDTIPSEPVQECIGQFVAASLAARQLSSHPIFVSH
jgi:hypothetical protein